MDSPRDKIMRRDLLYLDKDLEKAYRLSLGGYHVLYLKFFIIFELIFSIAGWLINPFSLNNFVGPVLVFNILNIFLMMGIFMTIVRIKKFKHVETLIILIQVYICIGYIESIQSNKRFWNSAMYSLSLLMMEAVLLIPMISRCSWKSCSFAAFFLTIYLNFRGIDYKVNAEMRGYPCFVLCSNCLFICLGSYFNEKFDRKQFFQRKKYENNLLLFEHLIKDVLPSSILIAKNQKVVFCNQEALRILKLDTMCPLDEQFDGIKLDTIIQENMTETLLTKKGDDDFDSSPRRLNAATAPASSSIKLSDFLKTYSTDLEKTSNAFMTISGKFIGNSENYNRNDNNLVKSLEIKVGKITWEGDDDALMFIITEDLVSHRLNYLSEQARYKDKLLATVSHDLRTPLNGVIGILELVIELITDPNIKKSLTLAIRSSHLLLYMINDILDFSQISNGKLRLNPTEFTVADVMKDISKLIKFQAKRKGLAFNFVNELQPLTTKIVSDPNRLKQIILNLLGNALKFTQQGFITLKIERGQDNEASVRFSVEDSGCGIKQEDIGKLFKLFSKLETAENTQTNTTGIGLGLAISQSLLSSLNRNSNDNIDVRSVYGQGSTFSFTLEDFNSSLRNQEEIENSCDVVEREVVEHNYVPTPFSYGKAKTLKNILVVDDDQINILVFKNILKSFRDCQCEFANDGKQALDKILENSRQKIFFDLVFMDCNMPVLDGFQATLELQRLIKEGCIPELPVIASTANASHVDFERCFKVGMVDYLSKPFTKKQLRAIIDKHFEKRNKEKILNLVAKRFEESENQGLFED